MNFTIIFIVLIAVLHCARGLYIKQAIDNKPAPKNIAKKTDDWKLFQQKLGLTSQKVELLKSQKDQQGTKELLHRFMKENPKYVTVQKSGKKETQFTKLYNALVKKIKMSKSMLKTSLNFELADRPSKDLKRSRRKIAVKMVSDMPSEHIDDLLKVFYQQRSSERTGYDSDDDDIDYNEADMPVSSPMEPDYLYENLYEDEEDVALSAKSQQHTEYGSFQDLILQAKRNQWERESEETKLHSTNNEDFI